MILDQFVFATTRTPSSSVDFPWRTEDEEIWYWRHYEDMDRWAQSLYLSQGGGDTDFDFATLRLTERDLLTLWADVSAGEVKSRDEFQRKSILDFTARAKTALAEGKTIYYMSSRR